ncbi:MAG: UDP-N-acetylglucosamine 1-carboxyvinyltransferase [Hungatella sp.]|nr:UDP-N-acetylglucosamine 1-carboxyvinyltransferase [Hungatella sp.]
MSVIVVQGYYPLKGEIEIQGSKNAVLPMMAAAVLHKGTTVLNHVPRIQDVFCMMGILESMGCVCNLEGHTLTIDAKRLICCGIPKEGGKAMRSSIILLGSLLGRCKEAVAYYPGGCSIGSRPIDLHLSALEKLGAKFEEEGEVIYTSTTGLKGTHITLSYPSVGATENVLLAAVGAEGNTILDGAAMEPEVEDLCWMLEAMGANIRGIGTGTLKIQGGQKFHDIQWQVPGDRIVAGTYLSAVMAAGGKALFRKSCPHQLGCVIRTMREMGAEIRLWENEIEIEMTGQPKAVSVETSPYPGFPTDLQSMMMVLLSVGEGTGYLKEKVFEGRFATAKELHKMGADIIIKGREALITGQKALKAAQVQACDLRGGAALVVAGLAAEGETKVTDCHHILRGYEDICYDLKSLGAKIRREA